MKQWGPKFTSLFFFPFCSLLEMSFQISWISVKQYNEKKKKMSHRNGVKITTLPNNQHTPAPSPAYPTPSLPLNITSQRNELVLGNHIGEK